MSDDDRPIGPTLAKYLQASRVKADLFSDLREWKFTVFLDYTATMAIEYASDRHIDPQEAAALALKVATRRGTSSVSLTQIPEGWFMSVPNPPDGPALLLDWTDG